MYLKQFWKSFEQSGDINTYLELKEYEKLYKEHTTLEPIENQQDDGISDIDRMS